MAKAGKDRAAAAEPATPAAVDETAERAAVAEPKGARKAARAAKAERAAAKAAAVEAAMAARREAKRQVKRARKAARKTEKTEKAEKREAKRQAKRADKAEAKAVRQLANLAKAVTMPAAPEAAAPADVPGEAAVSAAPGEAAGGKGGKRSRGGKAARHVARRIAGKAGTAAAAAGPVLQEVAGLVRLAAEPAAARIVERVSKRPGTGAVEPTTAAAPVGAAGIEAPGAADDGPPAGEEPGAADDAPRAVRTGDDGIPAALQAAMDGLAAATIASEIEAEAGPSATAPGSEPGSEPGSAQEAEAEPAPADATPDGHHLVGEPSAVLATAQPSKVIPWPEVDLPGWPADAPSGSESPAGALDEEPAGALDEPVIAAAEAGSVEPTAAEPALEEIIVPAGAIVTAAIDVGSTSLHLLVAAVTDHRVQTLLDESVFLGLGDRVATAGFIAEGARRELVEALATYVERARSLGADEIGIVGTEALRRAADAASLVLEVEARTGAALHVLEHEEEGRLTLLGVTMGHRLTSEILVVDVGGGSSEFVLGEPDGSIHATGLRLGAARLTRDLVASDPPTLAEIEALRLAVAQIVKDAPTASPREVIGVGGTASNLLRLMPATTIDRSLTRRRLTVALAMLTVERSSEAAVRHVLRPERARILPAGAVILDAILEHYGTDRMRVAEEGIREGLALALAVAGPAWRDRLTLMVRGWDLEGAPA